MHDCIKKNKEKMSDIFAEPETCAANNQSYSEQKTEQQKSSAELLSSTAKELNTFDSVTLAVYPTENPHTEIKELDDPFDDSPIAEKYKTPHQLALERLGNLHEHCAKIIKMYKLLCTDSFIPEGFEMNKLLDFNNIVSFDELLKTKVNELTTIDKKLACFPILVDALYILYARIVDETAPFLMMPRSQMSIQLQVNAMGRSRFLTGEQQAEALAGFLNFITEPTMKNLLTQHIPYIIANNFSISDVELMFKRNVNKHIKNVIAVLVSAAYKKLPAKIPQELNELITEPTTSNEVQKNE